MVMGRRRRGRVGLAVWVAVAALLVAVVVDLNRPDAPRAGPVVPQADPPARLAAPSSASDDPLAPGRSAMVTVRVANVWRAPGGGRPVDEPSLANPVEMGRWIATMSHEDKLGLVDRLVTQALYGERVVVQEVAGAWARVVVSGQPSSLDPNGYPGWIPTVQLRAGEAPATAMSAVVIRSAATLRDAGDPARPLLDLSYNTRLPVVEVGATEVIVALPTGRRGLLAAADVAVGPPGPRPTTSVELVAGARLFSGLPYLWAGTSSDGFDCSGFTAAVYGVHGVVLPRDADDQAGVGTPVERSGLQPGDLLFFSPSAERSAITHVSMYLGNGMMIQAPATGKTVETVPIDAPAYARQYWGARRYLPTAAGP